MHPPRAFFAGRSVLVVLGGAAMTMLCSLGMVAARPVFVQPTNWIQLSPSKSASDFKNAQINNAINNLRHNGGGTVYLTAGTYYLNGSIVIETQESADAESNPFHVRILGAKPITSLATTAGETLLRWVGASTLAVIDIRHAQNPTLENLRIQAEAGSRFKYGIFFHRVYSAQGGTSEQLPPTMLNILDSGISRGAGNFTVGVRLNNASEDGTIDQNVEHSYIENIYIQGATDFSGVNAAGIWIDGSQVQGQYFRNVNIDRSGTGIFNRAGQLVVVGGRFSNNKQATPLNNPSGGGDFVFRSGNSGGHLIQDIVSTGSYRFYTSFYEGQADLQSDFGIAIAIVGCEVHSLDPSNTAGDAILSRGSGGPLAIAGCTFGEPGGPPQKVAQGQWTQGSIVLSDCKFNHATGPLFDSPFDPSTTAGEKPKVSMVSCQGWDHASHQYLRLANLYTDPNDDTYTHQAPAWLAPRSLAARPAPTSSYTINLGKSFTFGGVSYLARRNYEDYDNAPVLNAAIAKVQKEAPGGSGTIWLPSGAYVIKSQINLHGAKGIRLLGVGGRAGFVANGVEPYKGSALIWNGPTTAGSTMLDLAASQGIALEGLFFTTYNGPGGAGATTIDQFIRIAETSAVDPSQGIWLQDIGADWLSGNVATPEAGVCNTLVHVGNGALAGSARFVTLLGLTARHLNQQAVLIDGAQSQDLQLLLAAVGGRRVVRTTSYGGSFGWIGGGAGNTDGQYGDPAVIDLDRTTGPVYLAGVESQDAVPVRALRTTSAANANPIFLYGSNFNFAGSPAQPLIDVNWAGGGRLSVYGSGLGGAPARIIAANGAIISSLANFHFTQGTARPWLPSGQATIQDLGSRAFFSAVGWPYAYGNWKYYSSAIGFYSLSPLSVAAGSSFPVSWVVAPGDTDRVGDYVGLFLQKSTPDAQPFSTMVLRDLNGIWSVSGTTAGTLLAPSTQGEYELRYFKNNSTRCTYRARLSTN